MSTTYTLPAESTAIPVGVVNWPSAEPLVPLPPNAPILKRKMASDVLGSTVSLITATVLFKNPENPESTII